MPRTRYMARGLAVVGAATLAAGLALPAIAAPGAEARSAPAGVAQAAALPEATEVEKAAALAAIGIVADGEWIILPDRSFVSRLLTDAKSVPLLEVRAAARAALDVEGADAATLFIRSGIFVAVEKDEARIRQEQLAKQQAREAKQRALAYLEVPATPELLDLPDDQFIRRLGALVTWDWGTRVQAGVNTALRGEAPQWKAFIETGVIAAHQADVEAYIQAQHDKAEAEKEALRQKDLKRRAASVVAWAPTEGELTLANDNFIRKIREKAVSGSEVSAAAFDAILSPEPAAWAAFLETGIHAASARDKQKALDREIAENRRLALEIQTKAEQTLVRPALVAAAKAALAGTPADVALFLRTGQFDALTQSLRSTTPKRNGWWVRSAPGDAGLTSGDSAGAPSAPIADVTWKVVDGLSDPACFSFESAERPGHYLRPVGFRVRLQPSDGGSDFKNAATWCAKKGLTGSDVSLEAKSQPGRYLRHLGTELWIANGSGDNAFDRACGFAENATWLIDAPRPRTAPKPAPVKDPCSDVASFYDYSGADTGLWLFNGVGGGKVTNKLAWRSGPGNWEANSAKPVSGDFTGDGKLDIAAFYDYGGNTTGLFLFDDVRGSVSVRKVWQTGAGHWALSSSIPLAGDFNGDGKDDIAVFYDYGGGHTRIFLFDRVATPDSTPYNHVTWDSGPGNWEPGRTKPVAGDFNADGRDDIAAYYDYGGNTTALFHFDNIRGPVSVNKVWQTGAGHWALSSSIPLAGDFDGDGKDDIAVFYDYGGGHTRIFLFDRVASPGSTPFDRVTWESGPGTWHPGWTRPVAGDFNGDGKADLAVFYAYPNDQTRIWVFDAVSGPNTEVRAAWASGEGNWTWDRGRPVN
jgi:hypothetical protein